MKNQKKNKNIPVRIVYTPLVVFVPEAGKLRPLKLKAVVV